ncbi:MAG TPA: glycoside hydrolase family 140 protein [Opitutaceae bacterium]|nr:glycoside hydrolase family 140 protein [Opitutaceae bacterium]
MKLLPFATPIRVAVASLFCIALSTSTAKAACAAVSLPAIQVNRDGHYLETADGRPFFWMGDTAWRLIHGTTRDEASFYLRTRAYQGFTVIQTTVLEGSSRDAVKPFTDDDPSRPNDAYFARVTEIVDEAADHGLYVALMLTWGDALTAPWGDGPRLFRLDNLPAARAYGRYLGDKLKARTNVIWLHGGDRPSRLDPKHPRKDARAAGFADDYDWRPIWREMAAGLAEGSGKDPLCSYHPGGFEVTSGDLHQESWLDFNAMQSGHGEGHDAPVWEWVGHDFTLSPAKPTLDLEPNYEDHPVSPWPQWDPSLGYFRDYDVRKQCYRSVLAGACGVTYGHHAVWAFAGKHNPPINFADRDWISAMVRPGAQQMIYLRQLIESRPFFSRIPDDTVVRNAAPAPAQHMTASRDGNGSYIFIYFPCRDQPATLDLTHLPAAQYRGWWYDPRTGFAESIGMIEGHSTHDIKSPSYGPDWVLVLDDINANYAPPGVVRLTGESAR